ncbi:M20/M25/M40 family metallo-hydrolase [Mycolicibacterium sp. 120266]|uniref:M42 family metallopeptidase n=1 Tax=Mycolicibacterium sp. 120266 TaxID=3090601 RepID=UPI00299EBE4A|nr:M20/M25/M40 family metallo-hydrolase [Mycolicibacterium sp. 120266]MDX1871986.1 M20/M25/M40 family metallo-hydrolase [Mycolicibacterium sp. 120266]
MNPALPDLDRDLLRELLATYGPCGQEDEVREICRRAVAPLVDETWVDSAGNLVGLLRGRDSAAAPIRVMAHMDELSMLVKRDGSLHVTQLGTMYPGNFGLGPVVVLGDRERLNAVLTLGSEHTTQESPRIWETKPDQGDKAMDWLHVYVFTGRTPEELARAGIGPGTRVCVDGSKRTLFEFGDYLGCYFLDDRAAIVAVVQALRELVGDGGRPAGDVYAVFTTNEEIGAAGGSYASRTLPGDLTLAVEVGPTEAEYATTCAGGPIVAYSDALCVYDKVVADRLVHIAAGLNLDPQSAVLGAFESDASHAKANGVSARAGLLCLPTMSTHGYEVITHAAIPSVAATLAAFLREPGPAGTALTG